MIKIAPDRNKLSYGRLFSTSLVMHSFERARLQSCHQLRIFSLALATEGCFSISITDDSNSSMFSYKGNDVRERSSHTV